MSPRTVSRAGVAATIAAVLVVIAGLFTLGTPSRARERKLDELRVDDLSRLSNRIDGYWTKHSALPQVLDSLVADRQLDRVPADPQSHQSYTYLVSGERSYRLCATFAQPSDSAESSRYDSDDFSLTVGDGGMPIARQPHSWRHGAGESCFDLTPPTKTSK
ncbi:MAG TPA: hypothetical protein VGO46_00925 [Gemmatimonadaceae bacterium]|jgi:hypothetical protein|nr:hypothetical protein [Gemmatimonadaceae bacterium]